MTIQLACPGCGRNLRVLPEHAGKKIKCSACGHITPIPAAKSESVPESVYGLRPEVDVQPSPESVKTGVQSAESARRADKGARPPTEGGDSCPQCGNFMSKDAVVCLDCGFNRKTGTRLKTVSKRFARQWDSGGFPYWARLVAFLVLLPLSAAPLFFDELEIGIILLIAWGLILFPLLGTLKRVIITRDAGGRPILIRQWWICFIPCMRLTTDLEDYRRIVTGAAQGGAYGWEAILVIVLLFLLCGLPGLIYALIRARTTLVTVEIAAAHDARDGPLVDTLLVYRGGSDVIMRQIGDTLKEIADMQYG